MRGPWISTAEFDAPILGMLRLWAWGLSLSVVVLTMGYSFNQQRNNPIPADVQVDATFLEKDPARTSSPGEPDASARIRPACTRPPCAHPTGMTDARPAP